MIRILHVFAHTNRGGAETMVMNHYRVLDRTRFQFDFINHGMIKGSYDDEIISLGGRVFNLPQFNYFNLYNYKKAWRKLLESHPEIQAIHIHYFTIAWSILSISKMMRIPIRIVHAHTSLLRPWIKQFVFNIFLNEIVKSATKILSCSKEAGNLLFKGHDFDVFYNAIDLDLFRFNPNVRMDIRRNLGINESVLLIGHTGSFSYPKNHSRIIRIFSEVIKLCPNAQLSLIGDGPLRGKIESLVESLGLRSKVIFLGRKDNVNDYLQAFDVFLFPSIYEGLPVSVIEAQVAGLPCVISDSISSEVTVANELIKFQSLNKSDLDWARAIVEDCSKDRSSFYPIMEKSDYNVRNNIRIMEKYYTL